MLLWFIESLLIESYFFIDRKCRNFEQIWQDNDRQDKDFFQSSYSSNWNENQTKYKLKELSNA